MCGVKRCNLAAALGYDASYVSRWVNDQKLPALRNNDALLKQIAKYVCENCPQGQRGRVIQRFALECPDPEDLECFTREVLRLLTDSYSEKREKNLSRSGRSMQDNAHLMATKENILFPESIFEALQELPSTTRQLNMVCTMPIHAQFKNNATFFRRVLSTVGPDKEIRVLQFVDPEDVQQKVDRSCRSFCYLMGLQGKIHYEFYELNGKKESYIFLIRDGLLLQYLREPFSREIYLLETKEPEILAQYGAFTDQYIRNRTAMTQRETMQKLFQSRYFLDYFMQPRCRCVLKRMQPIFFPETLQEKVMAGQKALVRRHRLFLDGSQFFESIILYQSALIDYIYTAKLMAFGTMVEIAPEDRLTHLQYMLEALSEKPNQLFILSTQNQICSYDDLPTSLFLSQHTAFALANEEHRDRVSYTVSSAGMVRGLNIWLDHMEQLPPEQCLTGEDAIRYISQCIRLL